MNLDNDLLPVYLEAGHVIMMPVVFSTIADDLVKFALDAAPATGEPLPALGEGEEWAIVEVRGTDGQGGSRRLLANEFVLPLVINWTMPGKMRFVLSRVPADTAARVRPTRHYQRIIRVRQSLDGISEEEDAATATP